MARKKVFAYTRQKKIKRFIKCYLRELLEYREVSDSKLLQITTLALKKKGEGVNNQLGNLIHRNFKYMSIPSEVPKENQIRLATLISGS